MQQGQSTMDIHRHPVDYFNGEPSWAGNPSSSGQLDRPVSAEPDLSRAAAILSGQWDRQPVDRSAVALVAVGAGGVALVAIGVAVLGIAVAIVAGIIALVAGTVAVMRKTGKPSSQGPRH